MRGSVPPGTQSRMAGEMPPRPMMRGPAHRSLNPSMDHAAAARSPKERTFAGPGWPTQSRCSSGSRKERRAARRPSGSVWSPALELLSTTWSQRDARRAWSGSGTGSRRRVCIPVRTEPVDGSLEPFFKSDLGLEAYDLLGLLGIEAAPRLAVGLGRIPLDAALEPGELHDQLDQVLDRDFHVGAEVERIGVILALRGQDDALGGVVHV